MPMTLDEIDRRLKRADKHFVVGVIDQTEFRIILTELRLQLPISPIESEKARVAFLKSTIDAYFEL